VTPNVVRGEVHQESTRVEIGQARVPRARRRIDAVARLRMAHARRGRWSTGELRWREALGVANHSITTSPGMIVLA
jgi:hypothetical protein